jgi:hypothetical protein
MVKRRLLITTVWMAIVFFLATPVLAEMIVDTVWLRRYNSPANQWETAWAVVVDDSGNVCVTGSRCTVAYDTDGGQLWVGHWGGVDIAIDSSRNVHVTGPSSDYLTAKYYPSGDTAWVRRYVGPHGDGGHTNALALGSSGGAYVTGASDGANGYDYATVKYHTDGDTVWVRRYDGPQGYDDEAYDLVVDGFDNVYVTGLSFGASRDYATIKYYPDGDTAWVRRYNGPASYIDEAYSIAVDNSGNVYVTGQSMSSTTLTDYATIKYYPNGDTAWIRRYNGPDDSFEEAYDVEVDNSGNVYVTGRSSQNTSYPYNFDYATVKYDSAGDELWTRRYNGPGNDDDVARALALDSSGNAYVTGTSWGSGTGSDIATIKYSPDGDTAWVIRCELPGEWDEDHGYAIALDAFLNVYVAGATADIGTDFDYVTAKYFQAVRGDVNRDWVIDHADIVYIINYLFRYGDTPDPLVVGDCNCDGVIGPGEIVILINYLFRNGPPPDCP